VEEALWLEAHGVDALIAQGFEAGGHRRCQRCQGGTGFVGATGVQVGTAYMLCPEATTSAVHRAALKSDRARTTALTNVFTGRPARGIVNRLIRERGPMNPAAPRFPFAAPASAPLRVKAEGMGNGDFSPLWAGQNVSGCKEIPAGILTQTLASQISKPYPQ
jgi:nitronate monooxygenase